MLSVRDTIGISARRYAAWSCVVSGATLTSIRCGFALSFSGSGYKVVFLAFPFEEYGTADQRADLIGRVFTFFGP